MFKVDVILDSVAPCGVRLVTIAATFPRIILSEVNTHRDRERNAASSRAIPYESMRSSIMSDPFIPIKWGAEQSGMQTGDAIPEKMQKLAEELWLDSRDSAVLHADMIHHIGRTFVAKHPELAEPGDELVRIHKSIPNRVVETYMWCTQIMAATEWNNYFRLRCHPDAEVHFWKIANMTRDALANSTPEPRADGEWHLPFVRDRDLEQLQDEGFSTHQICCISTARVARVSYLTHEGQRDPKKDITLFDRLVGGSGFGHWSPHGQVAQATNDASMRSGPFRGWLQFRKLFANENAPG
jgi:hypothetical protein